MWEKEGKARFGVECYYTGEQRLENNPYRDISRPYVIFGANLFYLLTISGVFVLRARHPDWPRPYRTWGYPVTPLLYVIAAWALVTGVFEVAAAIAFRKVLTHEWLLVVDGVLSFIVAGILFFAPVAGALAITWAIGFYALFSSGVLAAQAWRLRKVRTHGPAGGWAPAGSGA